MVRTGIIVLLLLLVAIPCLGANMSIRVMPDRPQDLRWLVDRGASFEDEIDAGTGAARFMIPDWLLPKIESRGLEYEVLIPDISAFAERAVAATNSSPSTKDVLLDHFPDAAETAAFLNELQSTHPEIISLTDVGATSSGLHDLVLVKISDNVDQDEDEPELFFEGNIHGDEIAGYVLNLHMIQVLVEGYDTDPNIKDLIDGREIFFLPATNADGIFANPRVRYNANGVDLNRDSGYMWHHNGASVAPFGEVETRTLFGIWQANQFVFLTSWHSGTRAFIYAWSCHENPAPDHDEMDALGLGYTDRTSTIDLYYQSVGLYASPYHGSTKDAAYGVFGTDAWTIELTDFKQVTWATAEESNLANQPALLWLIDRAGEGISGSITDADSGDPVAAVVQVDGKWLAYNDPEIGDLHKYLLPGMYDVTIWANGYAPQHLSDVAVTEGSPGDVSVSLEKDDSFGCWAMKWLYNFNNADEKTEAQTMAALGPPDGEFYSIGRAEIYATKTYEAFAVLDLGPDGLSDREGDDLYLYEGHDDGDETVDVYLADLPFPDDWTYLGTGTGDCSFDFEAAGISSARYVKIVDASASIPSAQSAEFDGYDLDAVGMPAPFANDDDDVTDDDDTDFDDDDDNDDTTDSPDDDDDSDADDEKNEINDESDSTEDDSGSCCG